MKVPSAGLEIGTDADTAFFWAGTAAGRLLAQRCSSCRRLRHPPSPVCPHCQCVEWTAADLGHAGILYSVAKVHAPGSPVQGTAYLLCLVDLDDPAGGGVGVRLAANLRGCELADAAIGARVEVHFEALAGTYRLPQFRLAS